MTDQNNQSNNQAGSGSQRQPQTTEEHIAVALGPLPFIVYSDPVMQPWQDRNSAQSSGTGSGGSGTQNQQQEEQASAGATEGSSGSGSGSGDFRPLARALARLQLQGLTVSPTLPDELVVQTVRLWVLELHGIDISPARVTASGGRFARAERSLALFRALCRIEGGDDVPEEGEDENGLDENEDGDERHADSGEQAASED